MLNTCLTVRAHTAGSHQGKGWEQFTDRVIDVVDRHGGANLGDKSGFGRGVVFLAWGAWAAKRVAKLNKVSVQRLPDITEGLVPHGPLPHTPFFSFLRFHFPFFFHWMLTTSSSPPLHLSCSLRVLMTTPTDQTPDSLECGELGFHSCLRVRHCDGSC
jgi:hypothetical protein